MPEVMKCVQVDVEDNNRTKGSSPARAKTEIKAPVIGSTIITADGDVYYQITPSPMTAAQQQWFEQRFSELKDIIAGLYQELAAQDRRQYAGERWTSLSTLGRLPRLAHAFLNRKFELGILRRYLLDESKTIVAVTGLGGMGKTWLVAYILKEAQTDSKYVISNNGRIDFDRLYYLRCNEERISFERIFLDLGQLAGRFTEMVQLWRDASLSLEEKCNALINLLYENCYLLIFDNFDSLLDSECCLRPEYRSLEQFFGFLLEREHRSKVIITSRFLPNLIRRRQLMNFVDTPLTEGLAEDDSVTLLRELGLEDEEMTLRQIARRTGGIPRALESFVGLATGLDAKDILANEALFRGNVVENLLQEQYEQLTEEEREVMQKVAIYRKPVWMVGIEYLTKRREPVDRLASVLHSVVRKRLVWWDAEEKTYNMHPLVREYTYAQIRQAKRRKWHYQAGEFYAHLSSYLDEKHKLADVTNQLEAHYHYFAAEDYERAGLVATNIFRILFRWGYINLCEELCSQTVDTVEGDTKAIALHQLARIAFLRGKIEAAKEQWTQALRIFESTNNKAGIAYAQHSLGRISQLRGEYSKALDQYELCLRLERELGDYEKAGVTLHQIAYVHFLLGDYGLALKECEEALEYRYKARHEPGVSISRHLRGMLYHIRGEYIKAMQDFDASLEIDSRHRNQNRIAICLRSQGNVLFDQGKYGLALAKYEESLKIQEQLENKLSIAECLDCIGKLDLVEGRIGEAKTKFEKAFQMRQEAGFRLGIAQSLHRLGTVYQTIGNYGKATGCFLESLQLKRALGNKLGMLESFLELARIEKLQENFGTAMSRLEECLEISHYLGYVAGIGESLLELGELDFQIREFGRARDRVEQSLEIFRKLGQTKNIEKCTDALCRIDRAMKENA
ncbi:MAG: tetratricopeptide repeat protein [Chloroflexi bacterium]|nr:tetratricopeptide repeat protein [Chloroflexota bacterium]